MVDRNITQRHRGGTFGTGEGMVVEIPISGFDWRAVVGGSPGIIDPFGESTIQEFPFGTKLVYGEQTFRYARMGAVAGLVANLMQTVVPLAGHIDEVINEPAVGAVVITFTPNTLTTDDLALNELQDGHIFIYNDTGEGHQYKILSHPAILGGESGVITLMDPIRVLPAAAATATVTHNRFRNVIVHPGPPTAMVVGVGMQAITANAYCWLATSGPTSMLIDGTVTLGQHVRPSEDDAGAVALFSTGETVLAGPIGQPLQIGADAAGAQATFGQIMLQLE